MLPNQVTCRTYRIQSLDISTNENEGPYSLQTMLPGGGKTSRRQFPKTRATWGHFTAKFFTLTACFLTLYGWQERIIMNKSRSWVWQGEKQELAAVQYLLLRTPLISVKVFKLFHGLFWAVLDPLRSVHGLQFSTAKFIYIRPVLSYLAVATATWQHCEGQPVAWGPPRGIRVGGAESEGENLFCRI